MRRRRLRNTATLAAFAMGALLLSMASMLFDPEPSHRSAPLVSRSTAPQSAAAATPPGTPAAAAPSRSSEATTTPIKHFIFVMQGARTFDNYFGTYPGADGIPANACQPYVASRPTSGCVKPFALHGTSQQPLGAGTTEVARQFDGGKMDGFVSAFHSEGRDGTVVMGHYDERDLPDQFTLAQQYVLFDRFFSSTFKGQRVNRNYWVSGAAPLNQRTVHPSKGYPDQLTIFDRMQQAGVDWKFYVQNYDPKQTFRAASATDPATQTARVPLLNYARFVDDPQLRSHIVDLSQYYRDLRDGTLPAVAYVASSGDSERTARSVAAGQRLVTDLINQLMLGPYWSSSAFMWSYDSSGGWYDHVKPPQVDRNGYGLRVPALLVSSYAHTGQVNHTTLDYTSALKFIEQNWRLSPLAARDAEANSLMSAFDFAAKARPARLITSRPVALTQPVVSVEIIYLCYGLVLGFAGVLVLFAFVGPHVRRQKASDVAPELPAAAPIGVS